MMQALFTAEGYPVEWAQSVEDFWGCPLHKGYGSTQGAGFIAATCSTGAVTRSGGRGCMHSWNGRTMSRSSIPIRTSR